MPEKRRLNLAFSMSRPRQREAWRLLSAIPSGRRTDAICGMVLRCRDQEALLSAVRAAVREELRNTPQRQEQHTETGDAGSGVLGFLLALQDEEE